MHAKCTFSSLSGSVSLLALNPRIITSVSTLVLKTTCTSVCAYELLIIRYLIHQGNEIVSLARDMFIFSVGAASANPALAKLCHVEGAPRHWPLVALPNYRLGLAFVLSLLILEVNRIVAAKAWNKISCLAAISSLQRCKRRNLLVRVLEAHQASPGSGCLGRVVATLAPSCVGIRPLRQHSLLFLYLTAAFQ